MNKVTKTSDVFSNLNDYLSKGDESVSFLDEIEMPLSEAEIETDNDSEIASDVKENNVPILNETVDLSKIDYNFIPTAKNKPTRKRAARNQGKSLSTNEDLSVVEVLPPKRSRLKKTEVCLKPSSDDDFTLDEENMVPKTRSGKLRVPKKAAQKAKAKPTKKTKNGTGHLSLEEAMALALEPLEELQLPIALLQLPIAPFQMPIAPLQMPLATPPRRAKRTIQSYFRVMPETNDVDLTCEFTPPSSASTARVVSSDFDLTFEETPPHSTATARPVSPDVDLTGGATPPHSTSPLFQPNKKYIEPSINIDQNDDCFDIDLVNIKLKLDEKIETHTIRKHQKFYDIFRAVADAHKISINDVLIYNDSKRIHYDDTPHSIAYRASIFFTCRIMEQSETVDNIEIFRRCRDENEIEIKVQSDKWSRPLKIKISKVEKFKVALDILAESVEFRVDQMRLIFDGDKIDINDTPMELEFEGGEIVDCQIID